MRVNPNKIGSPTNRTLKVICGNSIYNNNNNNGLLLALSLLLLFWTISLKSFAALSIHNDPRFDEGHQPRGFLLSHRRDGTASSASG